METRLSGHDVSIDPMVDDGEEGYNPLAHLASPDENPAQLLEREQTERLRHSGLATALENLDERSRRIIEARWLTEGRDCDSARTRRRIWRVGRAHTSDRGTRTAKNARRDPLLIRFPTPCGFDHPGSHARIFACARV